MTEDQAETDAGRRSVLPGGGGAPERDGDRGGARADRSRAGRRGRRSSSGCVPVLLVLVVLGLLGYVGVFGASVGGVGFRGVLPILQDRLAGPEDYAGPGEGDVLFEVTSGQSLSGIGESLVDEDVVASREAFTDAASADGANIQPGFYALRSQMSADEAVSVLGDADNIISNPVTVPEGLTVNQILDVLAKGTDFKRAQFQRVVDDGRLDLPGSADGDPEGYLFPATYPFGPDATPRTMLQAMVDRWRQAAETTGLTSGARQLGLTVQEVMTVASLVQAEGRGDDQPKVARVIYNRLSSSNDETGGLLQIDAAVNYALGESPIARLTTAEIDSVADSPYNTYTQPGLPPGPIEAPGEEAIDAALNPADGDWLYYVTVNLETGETKFADTGEEFQRYRAELDQYCATQSDRC